MLLGIVGFISAFIGMKKEKIRIFYGEQIIDKKKSLALYNTWLICLIILSFAVLYFGIRLFADIA